MYMRAVHFRAARLITKAGAEALLTAAMPLNRVIDKQMRLAYGTSLHA